MHTTITKLNHLSNEIPICIPTLDYIILEEGYYPQTPEISSQPDKPTPLSTHFGRMMIHKQFCHFSYCIIFHIYVCIYVYIYMYICIWLYWKYFSIIYILNSSKACSKLTWESCTHITIKQQYYPTYLNSLSLILHIHWRRRLEQLLFKLLSYSISSKLLNFLQYFILLFG